MQSKAATVAQYLAELPDDRRKSIEAVRKVIRRNLDKHYEEGMQYGMIGYYVPHKVYPPGYHCDPKQPLPFACLASQKNHMSLYLGCIYSDSAQLKWFRKAWADAGKKLDMGKACIRFRKLDNVPLEVIGETIRRNPTKAYIELYESVMKQSRKRGAAKSKRPSKAKSTASAKRTKLSESKSRRRNLSAPGKVIHEDSCRHGNIE